MRLDERVNFFLGVDDIEAYYRELTEKGAEIRPPVDEGWGGRFITVQDPDRYRFFFVQWSEETLKAKQDLQKEPAQMA